MIRRSFEVAKYLAVILMLASPSLGAYALQSAGRSPEASGSGDLTVDWTNQKSPAIHGFLSPSPSEYEKAIDDDKGMIRAMILLGSSMRVEFREHPKSIDFYDSTVAVYQQGKEVRAYNIGEMIHHQALSLAHVGVMPLGGGQGLLVCEYEGGFVGAREGFAILRFSTERFELHTLPLADFGKVVVFRSKPDEAEIWSALPYPRGTDAEPMSYSTQACRSGNDGYECSPPRRKRGLYGAATINDPGIEIRP
jgi:hypothetical protein